MRQSTLAYSLLLLAGATASQCAEQKAEQKKDDLPASSLQLVDPAKGESTFTWKQLQSKAAVVSIWNPSDKDQDVSIVVTDFNRPGGKEFGEVTAIPPGGSAGPQRLLTHKITRFVLTMEAGHDTRPLPGIYTAFLVIQGTNNPKAFSPLAKLLTVKVSSSQPALNKLTMVAWRLFPFSPLWCSRADVPLKESDFFPKPDASGTPIGFVQKDTGGFATVLWSGTKASSDGKTSIAEIKIDDLPHAGKYDGEVSFNKESDKTGVLSLGVVAKDIVIWPILVIIGGIYIAFVAKRYLGVLRCTWTLRKQEASIGDAFREAQKQFAEAAEGTPYGEYSVARDIATQRATIVQLLDALEKPGWVTSLASNTDYTAAASALQRLQSQIVAWGLLGHDLSSLAETVSSVWEDVDGTLMVPPATPPDEPEILKEARELLVGHVMNGTDIDPLRQQTADSLILAKHWSSINLRAKSATVELSRWQARKDLTDAQRNSLVNVRDELVAVWKHLWRAQAVADLAAISSGDLDSAEISLARISTGIEEPAPQEIFSVSRGHLFPPHQLISFNAFAPLSDLNHLPANDDRRLALLTAAIGYGDRGSAVLAFVIALLTGLSTYYLGKSFGTLQDYAVLFLWGAGTKATLDIVTSVLDKFSISLNKSTTPS
jgi:hypothetical protein